MDEFEKRIQKRPFRQVPPEWKTEVFFAANLRTATDSARADASHEPTQSWVSCWRNWLLSLRWHLAGLSAVWFLAITLNATSSSTSTPTALAEKGNVPSQPLSTALHEHYRQLVEWIDPRTDDPVARPPRRSQLRVETAVV